MTDPRYDAARAKLRRFLPPPPPDSGWGYARQRIEAQFLGPVSDDQASLGEAQLLFPAFLTRTDQLAGTDYSKSAPWLTDPHGWAFAPTVPAYSGAQGDWLDLWGSVLGVPREPSEPDGLYGPRILAEILSPTTTNYGLAQTIDQSMGVTGTQVLEATDVLIVYRLNSPPAINLRLNNSTTTITKRLNMAGTLGVWDLSACFVVQIPTGIQNIYDPGTIERIVQRRKAAGTRLVGIFMSDAGAIIAPDAVTVGVSTNAYVTPTAGATYAWNLTNGTILSGQGTSQITFVASSVGLLALSLKVVTSQTTTPYWKPIQAYLGVTTSITTPLYQYAGTLGATASIAMPAGSAATSMWTATGLDITSGATQPTVTFDVGQAETLATLTVAVANAAGASGSTTVSIKILPYTSPIQATTSAIAPNSDSAQAIPIGWAYDLVSVQVDHPAWVRIYNTETDLTADASRTITSDPSPTTNIVWEGIFTATMLTIPSAPGVKGVNGDSPRTQSAYVNVTNLDTTTTPIALTITRTETRTSGAF